MSETPQQHGWQQPDLTDPADDAARQQRGFGVFEAPSVPDDFPAFTPFSTLSQSAPAQAGADEFPPDSEQPSAFPGFPSEGTSSSYVPAPAVVPIPGVQHEAFPSEPTSPPPPAQDHDSSLGGSAGSWAAFAAGDTPRQPSSSPKPWEELSPFEASLDAASAPSSYDSYESSSYDAPSYESSSYEPSSSYESPSYESPSYEMPSYEPTSSYEPASYESSSSYESPSYESPSYESPSYESASSYEPASYEPASYEPASYEPASYEPASYESSSYDSPPEPSHDMPSYESDFKSPFRSPFEPSYAPEAMPEPEPEPMIPAQPPAPEPGQAPRATGSVRVAAAVPPGSRVEPADLADAPSQQPPKPTGRVYGSASVGGGAIVSGSVPVSPGQGAVYSSSGGVYGQPVDQAAAAAMPGSPGSPGMPGSPAAFGSPGMPGSPAAFGSPGMPGSPGAPGSPSGVPGMPGSPGIPAQAGMPGSPAAAGEPSTGMVRATARVSGTAQPNPGEAVPVAKSSTVYGSSTAAAAAAAPPAEAPAQARPGGRQHTFGDLLEPAAPPSIPMQRGPQGLAPGGVQMPPPPLGGQPGLVMPQPPGQQPGQPGQPGTMLQPVQPGQQHPGQLGQALQPMQPGQPGQIAPLGQQAPPRPMTTEAPPPKPERKVRLIIGVLVGCVLLLVVSLGGLLLIGKLVGPPFAVGDCVKQSANKQEAIAAACTDEGAYKVVSSVGSVDECDKEQPYVKIDDEILCLKPAAS